VARDDSAFGVSEDRINEAERLNGRSKLIDLALRMSATVARIGSELAHPAVGDDQPRR
jgi:hypothetical protein